MIETPHPQRLAFIGFGEAARAPFSPAGPSAARPMSPGPKWTARPDSRRPPPRCARPMPTTP